ncbi:PREDICTED: C-type lectin domain family 3 member A-like [Branchiostoma belcheri]|uniref:C-type lectin domain family 3 member A-like n=1 Tax=Branchiostoma belcheri TaxID=7741 RepID=A0A6P4Z9M9_BRABE|nr:PREDICTED: C-type lectin domain family 3 member A-like [Branchiostoma belcheri]
MSSPPNAKDNQRSRGDRTYPGGASGRRGVCSFLRAHRSCLAAGIAVLLSLVSVGLAPLTFINKQEISQLSTTFDAVKCDQYNMSTSVDALKRAIDGIFSTVDALKRDQDGMSTTVDALKRDQDDMSTTVDALKHYQDGMSTTVDALKRDQDGMSTTVDALKRDQDGMSTTVDALKRDQDGMSTTVDALKRNLDNERSRIAALEKRIHEIVSCPGGYTMWRGTCYKAFIAAKNFSGATAACGKDGGTLAMPRDAETDAFLIWLYKRVSDGFAFWFGLHDQHEEGKFVWVDGSQLGSYSSWGTGQPDNRGWKDHKNADCVRYSAYTDKWKDRECHSTFNFICQVAPGRP